MTKTEKELYFKIQEVNKEREEKIKKGAKYEDFFDE